MSIVTTAGDLGLPLLEGDAQAVARVLKEQYEQLALIRSTIHTDSLLFADERLPVDIDEMGF